MRVSSAMEPQCLYRAWAKKVLGEKLSGTRAGVFTQSSTSVRGLRSPRWVCGGKQRPRDGETNPHQGSKRVGSSGSVRGGGRTLARPGRRAGSGGKAWGGVCIEAAGGLEEGAGQGRVLA